MTQRIYYSKEAEEIARRDQMVSIVIFMVVGLGIGAVLALLFAPRRGDETRRTIANAVEDGYERGIEATTDALRDLEPDLPDLRKRLDELVSRIRR